jgi:hypothetical protein
MPLELAPISLSLVDESLEAERALAALQAELEVTPGIEVRRVATPSKKALPGTKGLFQDISLLITIAAPACSILVATMRAWIKSQEKHSIKIQMGKDSIELSGPWSQAQEGALNDFLASHPANSRRSSKAASSKSLPSSRT